MKNDMTVYEILEKKLELEENIKDMLNAFERETYTISSVDIHTCKLVGQIHANHQVDIEVLI